MLIIFYNIFNIQNIYEGDDRFTISKMEREKEKTDKLFQEQQEYLYDESGFLNPNLDLSKNPLRNKKYTLYNPYNEDDARRLVQNRIGCPQGIHPFQGSRFTEVGPSIPQLDCLLQTVEFGCPMGIEGL